ncbi:hypothetical protein GPX89_12370 [Nocardia sp. ET3-3]|uniref:Peptide chain release factor 1 n=1 Tax=Nocardia terrae TaxID=2675851 RepID=A0A7K1UUJ4_9NOCA|nr:peptide chain release factor-like protein [Nocardia terrae]MVU78037.1 hypothetical protein [Nocardia terrae]
MIQRERFSPDESDIRIDTYCSRRPGQDSAVYLTHLPTGIAAWSGSDGTQAGNKLQALRLLAARMNAVAEGRFTADLWTL